MVQECSKECLQLGSGNFGSICCLSSNTILLLLAGCGKTIVARWKFNRLHVYGNRRMPRRMLKKAVQQGRSEQRGEAYASVR
jgi:hypothetical protein